MSGHRAWHPGWRAGRSPKWEPREALISKCSPALGRSLLAVSSPPDFDTNNQIENQGGEQKRKKKKKTRESEREKKRRSIYLSRESKVDRVELIPRGWEVPTKTKTASRTRRRSWGQVSAVIPASSS